MENKVLSGHNFFMRANRPIILIVLIAHSLQGCLAWRPLHQEPRPAVSLPIHYQGYYDYPEITPETKITLEENKKKYLFQRVEIPLSLPEDLKIKNEIYVKQGRDSELLSINRFDVYWPKKIKPGEQKPVILISSILGGTQVVDFFARFYARRGFIAVLVHRKKPFWDESQKMSQVEDQMRIAIIRLRQVLDWIETQPQADQNRIGAFGISYGAILHSVLAAVEPRIHYHILAMPADRLANVIMKCKEKSLAKLVKKAESSGLTKEEIHQQLLQNIVTDPFYLAPYTERKNIQIYAALFDRVVGSDNTFNLWKRMNRPTLKVLPFGHYGGIVLLPYLQWSSYFTFKRKLKASD